MKKIRSPELRVEVAELARSIGVNPESVVAWAKRKGHRCSKVRGRNHISLKLAELYFNLWGLERVARRPRGWPTIKALQGECGVGRLTVEKAIGRGQLRAVVCRKVIYLNPDDAKRFVLEYKSTKPLPGWVLVPKLRDETGRSKEALNQWIRREEVEVRCFLHPTRNRPTPYIREEDAERYRQVVEERGDRHVGLTYKNGEDTKEVVARAIAAAGGKPLDADEIAEASGISRDTCVRVTAKLAQAGVLERHGRGTAHHPYRYSPLRRRVLEEVA